jgi:AcrR family transcriptional regulator
MSPISRKDQRKEEARGRILEVAEQLFVREASYDEATIREIARRAGISVGSVYLHFKTKADILAALANAHGKTMLHRIEAIAAMPAANGYEKLEELFRVFKSQRNDRSSVLFGRLMVMYPQERIDEEQRAEVTRNFSYIVGLLAGIIRQGMEDGSIRTDRLSPELQATTLLNLIMAFARDILFSERLSISKLFSPFDEETVFNAVIDFLISAFRGPAATPKPGSDSP